MVDPGKESLDRLSSRAAGPDLGLAPDAERRRLLVIGINYVPEETGIAPYTTSLAEHMAARSWEVSVVTGLPSYPQWRVFDEYRGMFRRREWRGGVELHRLWHYVPTQQSAIGRAIYEGTFLAHVLAHGGLGRPDCVLGIVPSLGGGAAGALKARRWQVPFGLIVQDLMGQAAAQSGIPGGGLAAWPAGALERWVIGRADGVAIVSESFREHVVETGADPSRIRHVPNWAHVSPPSGRAQEVRRSLAWPANEQVVLHAGNMGYKQGLDNVLATARIAASDGLAIRFVLMGDGNERRRLEIAAAHLPNVQFLAPQPQEIFMDVLAAADVLLVSERATVVDMSLPSKITSYLRAERPVVGAVPLDGSTAKELMRTGGALVVPADDPLALIAALRTLEKDPTLCRKLVTQGERYATERLNRTLSLERLEQFIGDLYAEARPRQMRTRRISLSSVSRDNDDRVPQE